MSTTDPFPPPDPDGWTPDLDPADVDATPAAAEVVDLDKARTRRADPDQPTTDDTGTADDVDGDEDAESLTTRPEQVGVPVDPPDHDSPRAAGGQRQAPILPAWAHSRADITATARHAAGNAGYVLRFHAVRTPKYAAKIAVWAPIGFLRTLARLLRWATAEEGNWGLRQDAARRNDPETWLKLDRQRQRQTSVRWPILIGGSIAALVAAAVLWFGPTPALVRWLVFLAVLGPVLSLDHNRGVRPSCGCFGW
ncbi:hypothetical protein FMEAI12_2220003 [Parafrankia sp. Ea1.12]|uniref:hypothetical protein n=1 Tax=Parafrankia sp. Ea1.12 TaxID=573499 RepID=UPI000DA46226|nr:hypothetical protein [Parafrankia sp. Ea1.12]SQD94064.1 hypothetical protein FMEAI12_2220003 [Parafrankia sp. Ea1.12]